MRSLRIDNTELEIKERDLKGEFVSHYTSVKTLIEYILPSQKIKFSTLEKLNDPYEYRVDLGIIRVVFNEVCHWLLTGASPRQQFFLSAASDPGISDTVAAGLIPNYGWWPATSY